MCRSYIIECDFCWCAILVLLNIFVCLCATKILLNILIAGVQLTIYWADFLLMCIGNFIEILFCLCARWYLFLILLMCRGFIIEMWFCLCASRSLLSNFLANVQCINYWNRLVAYVHQSFYWLCLLLVCRGKSIE